MKPRECAVHKHRFVVPLDEHHVWPLAYDGPDTRGNILVVCPNGHRRIHDYIRLMLRYNGKVPWLKRKFFGHKVRLFGTAGYDAIMIAGEAK